MLTLSSLQAQNKFGELIDSAQREPVAITRRGRTVAYVIDHYTYRRAMSEMFPLRGDEAVAEIDRVLAPARARSFFAISAISKRNAKKWSRRLAAW